MSIQYLIIVLKSIRQYHWVSITATVTIINSLEMYKILDILESVVQLLLMRDY